MSLAPTVRVVALAAATVVAATIVAAGGCTKAGVAPVPSPSPGASGSPTPVGSPTPTPSPTAKPNFAVSLNYTGVAPTTDPTFGPVDGYGLLGAVPQPSVSVTPAPSQIVNVTSGMTVTFYNFDSKPHTASLLSPVAGPSSTWPPTFNNVNGASVSSPQGTAITTAQFSTGNLNPGSVTSPTTSLQYQTGAPGMYFFGDYYDYLPIDPTAPHMRTVIIVH